MLVVGLGLLAALSWGLHDLFVRKVSQRQDMIAALATVLLVGMLITIPLSVFTADWSRLTAAAFARAGFAGLVYVLAGYALYRAFAIGPVRLVAPIVGGYPALSIAWAYGNGEPIQAGDWLAVLLVIVGIAIVALLSPQKDSGNGNRRLAIIWAGLAAGGFALTFAQGQWATDLSDPYLSILFTRIAAFVGIIAVALVVKTKLSVARENLPILVGMGVLDAIALWSVIAAGSLANASFASVAASLFGVVTVVLAWVFLKERMSWGQWAGVALVFGAVASLGL